MPGSGSERAKKLWATPEFRAKNLGARHPVRRAIVKYARAHERLGKVSGPCVDCGKPARHWSLRHDTPSARILEQLLQGRIARFSLDPGDYVPRCVRCHQSADGIGVSAEARERLWRKRREQTHCKNGHAFDEANTYFRPTGGRICRACNRARQQARKDSGE